MIDAVQAVAGFVTAISIAGFAFCSLSPLFLENMSDVDLEDARIVLR